MRKVYLVKKYADQGVVTEKLQAVIDLCAKEGGGQVRFEAGTYLTATLELRSGVELYLDAGATIRGAENCTLYYNHYWEASGETAPGHVASERWFDALICAYNQQNISIVGQGVIDGVDCYNPTGEQQFRGPHGVFLYQCEGITLKGFSIVRSSNYALQFHQCGNIHVDSVNIYGGQDAIRIFNSHDAVVENCDFRTGDDCVSGVSNTNLSFINCKFNTPGGNMFLVGCKHMLMRGCKFWGPGEYPATFKENKRYSVGHAAICMLHDSGSKDEIMSDDWLLENIEIENIEYIFRHDNEWDVLEGYEGRVVIDGIRAINYVYPFTVTSHEGDPLDLTIRNGVFMRRTDRPVQKASFLRGAYFAKLTLENIQLYNCGTENVIELSHAGDVSMKNVYCAAAITPAQFSVSDAQKITMENEPATTLCSPYVVEQTDSLYVPIDQDETFLGPKKFIKL